MPTRPLRPVVPARAAAVLLLALTVPVRGQLSAGDPMLRPVAWRGHQVVADELLVQFSPDVDAGARAAHHAALDTTPLSSPAPGLERVRLRPGASLDAALAAYGARAGVVSAQPNILHQAFGAAPPTDPDDPGFAMQWGLTTVGAPAGWERLPGRPDVLVAIIDSGVDATHPDLAARFAGGLDPFGGDDNPADGNGHGTHCAGIAAAATGNATGIAGAANGCSFLAYRCGNTSFPTSALVPAIHDARARGAHVLSMSWGSTYNDPAVRSALAAADADGIVLVAAAGNNGTTQPFYPAALPFVIGVAASRPDDGRASFSNHGAWVDLAAPGQGIYSTWKNGAYTFSSGTSMAAPLVAGLAALLYAQLPGARGPDSAALVRGALRDGAVDVGGWVAHGRIDFAGAADALLPPPPPLLDALSSATLAAVGGDLVELTGSHLSRTEEVRFGALAAPSVQIVDDGTLAVVVPVAAALGPVEVAVLTPGGESAPLAAQYVPTDPPRVAVAATVPDGGEVRWTAGGAPGALAWLLVAVTGDTVPLRGLPILRDAFVLAVAPLDARGLLELSGQLPPGHVGVTFHSQLATVAQGVLDASAVASTQIVP